MSTDGERPPQPRPALREPRLASREAIQTALHDFVLKQFPAARKRGTSAADSLLEHGIIDSLGVLDIVRFIEEELRVPLLEHELVSGHFDSVASMAELIHSKTTERAPWTS
jgi:acyl carrier protein